MVTLSFFTWGREGTGCPFLGPAFSTKCVQSLVCRLPPRMSLPAGTGHGQEAACQPRSLARAWGLQPPAPEFGAGCPRPFGAVLWVLSPSRLSPPASPSCCSRFCCARGPHVPTAGGAGRGVGGMRRQSSVWGSRAPGAAPLKSCLLAALWEAWQREEAGLLRTPHGVVPARRSGPWCPPLPSGLLAWSPA